MTFKAILRQSRLKVAIAAAVTVMLGWQFYWMPAGQFLADLSYDLPFAFTQPGAPSNIVLVELDEVSHMELHQTYGERWDRRLHARLLDYLRADGANLVVFDIDFNDSGTDAAVDQELADAIRAHGRVVLAADVDDTRRKGIVGRVIPPIDILRDATTNWGPMQAEMESDGVVRRIYRGTEQKPSMAWVAASLMRPAPPDSVDDHLAERWVHYYGPAGTLPRVSYSQATNQPAGFYRGKTVFIGGRPKTRFVAEEVDEFRTPWRLRDKEQISGLELTATEFLNLSRGDYLKRVSTVGQFGLVLLFGMLAGGGLMCVRPVRAVLLTLCGVILVTALALILFFGGNLWFDWCVVAFVQIPCGLVCSLAGHWWQLKKEKEWLETPMPGLWDDATAGSSSSSGMVASTPATANHSTSDLLPAIPDHELIRQVGRGAYGDVWLARDVLGNFHAVKIIRRDAFDHLDPYEREFRGLQKFAPISRAHPGLMHILHAGQNITAGYFYYIMEAGDDERSGSVIDPKSYTPRSLGRDLRRRGPFPANEAVGIGIALCEALAFLHQRGLIHRDIKPANIIFVEGRPKLADIGLVTEFSHRRNVSKVGTEGYLPPEGPGTPAADVYALGRVLEEMIQLPSVAGNVKSNGESATTSEALESIRLIIRQACAENPDERFPDAEAMREALLKLMAARNQ